MRTTSIPFLIIMIGIILLSELCPHHPASAARKGGGRRRKHRIQMTGSTKMKSMSPRMREHSEHPDGAVIVKASHFDYEFELGHKIAFICVARGDPPPQISWYKDSLELFDHPMAQIKESHLSDKRVRSKLEIDPACQMDVGTYECQASNTYRMDRKLFKADFSEKE